MAAANPFCRWWLLSSPPLQGLRIASRKGQLLPVYRVLIDPDSLASGSHDVLAANIGIQGLVPFLASISGPKEALMAVISVASE